MTMNKQTKTIVGENVKRLRKAADMSAASAAQAIGVDRTYWYLLENGTVNFTIEKLETVAGLFKVTVADLIAAPRNGGARKRA